MRTAFFLLLCLIGISPLLLFIDGPQIHALLIGYAAIMVGVIGASLYAGETKHLTHLLRPIAVFAILLAIWMLVQIIPLPIGSWTHPIWASAESALGEPIAGSITIDPGATLVAICRYSFAMAVLFVAIAITIDRLRAEWALFWLVSATTFAAMAQIIHDFFGFTIADEATGAGIRTPAIALSALGVIIAATAALRAIERYEARRTRSDASFSRLVIAVGISFAAFAICSLAVVFFASTPIIFAIIAGFALMAILVAIRRLGLGFLAGGTLAAIAVVVAIAIAGTHIQFDDLTFHYSFHQQSSLISMTQRIIEDTGWLGTGAGTFSLLLPIYQGSGDLAVGMRAPTSAAQIVIELGKPAFWIMLLAAAVALCLLVRGALQRGRDSFYPAAGAGCLIILTFEAFCDLSMLNTAVVICAATALGLGFAQSVSRVD